MNLAVDYPRPIKMFFYQLTLYFCMFNALCEMHGNNNAMFTSLQYHWGLLELEHVSIFPPYQHTLSWAL